MQYSTFLYDCQANRVCFFWIFVLRSDKPMSNTLTPQPPTPIVNWPSPYYPSLPLQGMPQRYLDGLINNYGVRLGWMKSHQCACTYGYEVPGTPDPNCNTCNGRGYFWDAYNNFFNGLLTFMHGFGASPDEPGAKADPKYGNIQHAEPTLTIPYSASTIWQEAQTMDAFVEIDAQSRYSTVLVAGENNVLPYQQGLNVQDVYIFDPTYQVTYKASAGQYTVDGAAVSLVGFPNGTAYTVEFIASPVYIAWREAGGMSHARPFAAGLGQIPRRFRIVSLDIWTRARNQYGQNLISTNTGNPIGTEGQGFGIATEGGTSTSPQAIS